MGKSETRVQADARVAASAAGGILWRNNVGAAVDIHTGRPVRYGLANDSKKVNKQTKSSDLVGITPTLITPAMVGKIVGIFTAVECKAEGWEYSGTPEEAAQLNYINIVKAHGGLGGFESGQ